MEHLELDGTGSIDYAVRDFESECFDNRSLEIVSWDCDDLTRAIGAVESRESLTEGDFIWTRIPTDDIDRIAAATDVGFHFVESTIIPFLSLRGWDEAAYHRVILPMGKADEDTIGEVEEIAKSTFKGLRFNLDRKIGDDLADTRYLRWLRNAFESGQDVRVIHHKGRIAGFSLLKHLEEGRTIYVLSGLHPDYKNTGLGLMLYASTVAYCRGLGVRYLEGGISVANTPVLNVMSCLGFSYKDPSVVLHYHVG